MSNYVLKKDAKYWSPYGWAPVSHAMRFLTQHDAQSFKESHGLADAAVTSETDHTGDRPDVAWDYNPFSTR